MEKIKIEANHSTVIAHLVNSATFILILITFYIDIIGKISIEFINFSISSDRVPLILILLISSLKILFKSDIINREKIKFKPFLTLLAGTIIFILGILIKEEKILSIIVSNPDKINFSSGMNMISNLPKTMLLFTSLLLMKTGAGTLRFNQITSEKIWLLITSLYFFCYQSLQPYFHRMRNPLLIILSILIYLIIINDKSFQDKFGKFFLSFSNSNYLIRCTLRNLLLGTGNIFTR